MVTMIEYWEQAFLLTDQLTAGEISWWYRERLHRGVDVLFYKYQNEVQGFVRSFCLCFAQEVNQVIQAHELGTRSPGGHMSHIKYVQICSASFSNLQLYSYFYMHECQQLNCSILTPAVDSPSCFPKPGNLEVDFHFVLLHAVQFKRINKMTARMSLQWL